MTPKQERFVAEYIVDLNATQAAIRAGYSVKTARAIGFENLTKPHISDAVARAQSERLDEMNVEAGVVLRELSRLATSDLRQLFREDGSLLPIDEMPDEVAAAISSIEVVTTYPNGKDEPPEYVKKVRLWDKNTALTNLAKHFGLLKDLVEHSGPGGGPIVTKTEIDPKSLSKETLKRILAESEST